MNKKLLVMVMVPVLVVMSGALAFSAFTGSITTQVNASAGYISFNQEAWLVNYTQDNTVMTVGGTTLATGPMSNSFSPMFLGWAGLDNSNNVTSQTVSVENMAPGNWVTFEFQVTNNGSVGFYLSGASPVVSVSSGLTATGASSWSEFTSDMAGTGYVYLVSSIPSSSIDNGGTATYYVAVGLGSSSTNTYQESSMTLTITVSVTSDP